MKTLADKSIIRFCIESIFNEFEKHINPTKARYCIVENDKLIKPFSSLLGCLEYIRSNKLTCEIRLIPYDYIEYYNTPYKYYVLMKITFTIIKEKVCDCCKKSIRKYNKQCVVDVPILNDDSQFVSFYNFHKLIHTILMEKKPHTIVDRYFADIRNLD